MNKTKRKLREDYDIHDSAPQVLREDAEHPPSLRYHSML